MRYTLKEILDLAEAGGFAVPAFNVYNAETALGVMKAAEKTGMPVIFQLYSRLFDTGLAQYIAPLVKEAIYTLKTPAAFHLDHGAGEPEVIRAIQYGATGVMIDGSTSPLAENIAITKSAVAMARAAGIGIEGELGHIGSAANGDEQGTYTAVDEAVRFAEETDVDALAVMVGTAHGHYKKAPVLAIDRIAAIHGAVKAHLVLHGGSGVPDDQIRAAVKAGIRKINYGTDVCCAFIESCKKTDPYSLPLDKYMQAPTEAVCDFAVNRIELLGKA